MTQQLLFAAPPPAEDFFAWQEGDGVECDPEGYRWYQREAHTAIYASLNVNRSTLAVLATGLGKTVIFSGVSKTWTDGPVLVLVHRDELVTQARKELERATGLVVEIEQGDWRASHRAQIVVGSVQSVCKQNRLDRMGRDRFSLIVVDEAHHSCAPIYKRIFDFFNAKILGVTATPDRADEKALGQVYDDVCYVMDIVEGIDSGYLVPISPRSKEIILTEIDLNKVGVGKVDGKKDLQAGALDEEMCKGIEGIVHKTLELEPDRQGIGFFPGVKSAEYATLAFNRRIPNCAAYVDGETDRMERRAIVAAFKRGEYKYLCNCGVFTEGFDAPNCSLIIQARPTLSRALYAQMCGRGTRTWGFSVDAIPGKEAAAERRSAIAHSPKPDLVILDFVGNSQKHTLMTPVDILAGNYSEAELKLAKKKVKESGGDPRAALLAARRELERLATITQVARVQAVERSFNPFSALGVAPAGMGGKFSRFSGDAITTAQWRRLEWAGLEPDEITRMSKGDAMRLIGKMKERAEQQLASYDQLKKLAKLGITDQKITYERAQAGIRYAAAKDFGRKGPVDPKTLNEILYMPRQAGED